MAAVVGVENRLLRGCQAGLPHKVDLSSTLVAAEFNDIARQEFQREVPDHRIFAINGQFKMFNSAMIAGISAIIDPRGPDGDQMRCVPTSKSITFGETDG